MEELRISRMRFREPRHRHGASQILQAVARFVRNRLVACFLLLQVAGVAAALNHEAGNYAVKYGAVVVAAVDQFQQVPHGDGCAATVQFHENRPGRGFEFDVRMRRHGIVGGGRERATKAYQYGQYESHCVFPFDEWT
jgi:hypothetical protein